MNATELITLPRPPLRPLSVAGQNPLPPLKKRLNVLVLHSGLIGKEAHSYKLIQAVCVSCFSSTATNAVNEP